MSVIPNRQAAGIHLQLLIIPHPENIPGTTTLLNNRVLNTFLQKGFRAPPLECTEIENKKSKINYSIAKLTHKEVEVGRRWKNLKLLPRTHSNT